MDQWNGLITGMLQPVISILSWEVQPAMQALEGCEIVDVGTFGGAKVSPWCKYQRPSCGIGNQYDT